MSLAWASDGRSQHGAQVVGTIDINPKVIGMNARVTNEIYLGDPCKTSANRLKTVVRHPVGRS